MSTLKGLVSLLLLVINTLIWSIPLLTLILLKVVAPGRPLRRKLLKLLNAIAVQWIGFNLWWMRRWLRPDLHIDTPEGLSPDRWWLVVAIVR